MADPVIASHYRALVIFPGSTGLPEDRFVNNFCFADPGLSMGHQTAHETIVRMLTAFYAVAPEGQTARLLNFMSTKIGQPEIRTYELGYPPPREPIITQTDWGMQTSGNPLPHEVAATISFRGASNTARQRGRIFIGPLGEGARDLAPEGPRVSSSFRTIGVGVSEDMANSSENLDWVVLSQVEGASHKVVGGWVDDAFDTIRSRGLAATGRTTWGVSNPTS